MKKTLSILTFCALLGTAQGALVVINCYSSTGDDGSYKNNFNVGGGTAGAGSKTMNGLVDQKGNTTAYGISMYKSGGNYFNNTQAAFTNTAAYNEVLTTFGMSSIDNSILLNAVGTGAGGSRTGSITLSGLGGTVEAPLEMTLYMWVGSATSANGGAGITGATTTLLGEFSYATNATSGFSSTLPATAAAQLVCVKWTGMVTTDSLTFTLTGGAKTGPSLVMFDIHSPVIPEPATASLGLLGISVLLLRRRRA